MSSPVATRSASSPAWRSAPGCTSQPAATCSVADDHRRVGRTYAPEAGFHKQFCGNCGSQLFTVDPDSGDVQAVRFGTLDDPPPFRCWATSSWHPLPDDGAPRFDERM